MYEHEVDKPQVAPKGKMPEMMGGLHAFKSEGADQIYGQAGKSGCERDLRKIKAQEFDGAYKNDGY